MADGQGYLRFPDLPVLLQYSDPIIDGVQVDGQLRAFTSSASLPGNLVRAMDGSHVLQWPYVASRAPVSVAPLELPFAMLVRSEAQYLRVLSLMRSGIPVTLFFGWPHVETWLVAANPTPITWNSSRRTAWNGSTITHATHPPRAWVDGVEQDIVTAAPAAGEVQVPATQPGGQGHFTVTTPSLAGAAKLELLYWPEYYVRFEDPREQIPQANELVLSATLREVLPSLPDS